jgi:putative membrane protein
MYLFVKGICMGTADIIPGVSGGTVALILGVYRRLIEGIRAFTPRSAIVFARALPGVGPKKEQMWEALRAHHVDFLVPLGLGIVSAILIAAQFIPDLLEAYPSHKNALFFGLILGSVYVPYSHIPKANPLHAAIAVVAGLAAFALVSMPVLEARGSLPFLFVCGAIAICAMVLPGVSGSYLLKALGQYEVVLKAVRDHDFVIAGVFMAGIVVGITSFVRVLAWLLRRHEGATLAALTGLMVGSLRSVWPFQTIVDGRRVNQLPEVFGSFELGVFGLLLLGLVVVFGLLLADKRLSSS